MAAKFYTPRQLAKDAQAMLLRRDIHVAPSLVRLLCYFAFEQVAARPKSTTLRAKLIASGEVPVSRDMTSERLKTMYPAGDLKRRKTKLAGSIWRSMRVRFTEADHRTMRRLERAIEATIRRRDYETRHAFGRGWKSSTERQRAIEMRDVMRRAVSMFRP